MIEDPNLEKQGLSDYSRQLAADAKELLGSCFSTVKNRGADLSERELAYDEINKDFVRTCLVSIFADMNQEERKAFKEQTLDTAKIIETALDKLNVSEEDKKIIDNELAKITPEAMSSPSRLLKALNLLDHESPMYRLKKTIYNSLQEKSEAAEAYSYLNFTS